MDQVTLSQNAPVWKLDVKGFYSIRSGYGVLIGDLPKVAWWRLCWCKDIFPRHGFIMWLAILDKLRTKSMLFIFTVFLLEIVTVGAITAIVFTMVNNINLRYHVIGINSSDLPNRDIRCSIINGGSCLNSLTI
ncbi:hypothetical protein Droror1_Dr00024768 [Drosera rotundifolia]